MTKIHFYSSDPKECVNEIVRLALKDAGNFVAENQEQRAESSRLRDSVEDMLVTDMLAMMVTGKPLNQVEDYI